VSFRYRLEGFEFMDHGDAFMFGVLFNLPPDTTRFSDGGRRRRRQRFFGSIDIDLPKTAFHQTGWFYAARGFADGAVWAGRGFTHGKPTRAMLLLNERTRLARRCTTP
jgi:hypothetical protein